MPKISATSSMGLKLKMFSDWENVSPHYSISVERDAEDAPDEVLVEEAGKLYKLCRDYIQARAEEDIASAKKKKR